MTQEMPVMRIKSGRQRQEDGTRVKIRGYAPKIGRSLQALLHESGAVKMTALGDGSVNTMVKAITHARTFLLEEGHDLVAEDFQFEVAEMNNRAGESVSGKLVSVIVRLK